MGMHLTAAPGVGLMVLLPLDLGFAELLWQGWFEASLLAEAGCGVGHA